MYTDTLTKLLNALLTTARQSIRENKLDSYKNMQLFYALTCKLDPDTIWECGVLAARQFRRDYARLVYIVSYLSTYTPEALTGSNIRSKITSVNPLHTTNKSLDSDLKALDKAISTFKFKNLTAADDLRTYYNEIPELLYRMATVTRVLQEIPSFTKLMYTDDFRSRVVKLLDTLMSTAESNQELLEAFASVRSLLDMSSTEVVPAGVKYSGTLTLPFTTPATTSLGPPVYSLASDTNIVWNTFNTWTIKAGTKARVSLGSSAAVPPSTPVDGIWEIGVNNVLYVRLNGTEIPLTLTTDIYFTSVAFAAHVQAVITAASLPLESFAEGNVVYIRATIPSEGIQLYIANNTPASVNETLTIADTTWSQGGYSTVIDAPGYSQDITFRYTRLPATVANDVITMSALDASVGDIVQIIEYTSPTPGFGTPLSAQYAIVGEVTPGLEFTLKPYLGSSTVFSTYGIPRTIDGDPVLVNILRHNIYVSSGTDVLSIAGSTDLGLTGGTYYGTSTAPTGITPDVVIRRGDLITAGSSSYTVLNTSPLKTLTGIPVNVSTCVVNSGLREICAGLPLTTRLRSDSLDHDIYKLVERLRESQVWSGLANIYQLLGGYGTDWAALDSTLSTRGLDAAQVIRTPMFIQILRQAGFDNAAAMLAYGDINYFFSSSVQEASTSSMLEKRMRELMAEAK